MVDYVGAGLCHHLYSTNTDGLYAFVQSQQIADVVARSEGQSTATVRFSLA